MIYACIHTSLRKASFFPIAWYPRPCPECLRRLGSDLRLRCYRSMDWRCLTGAYGLAAHQRSVGFVVKIGTFCASFRPHPQSLSTGGTSELRSGWFVPNMRLCSAPTLFLRSLRIRRSWGYAAEVFNSLLFEETR